MEKQPSRKRVLTDDELRAVWAACERLGQFAGSDVSPDYYVILYV
jgi:hypothetical protein